VVKRYCSSEGGGSSSGIGGDGGEGSDGGIWMRQWWEDGVVVKVRRWW
jgi:hypothetical protein